MNTPIHDFLVRNALKNDIRLYMPGHKGEFSHDITEIHGADSLYESDLGQGIIYESERNATSLFSSLKTLYSCSGSTLAIQTMLALLRKQYPNKKNIAAFRYAHRSLIHSAILLDFDVNWIYADEYLSCDVSAEAVLDAIDDETAGVFLNSIDYYGGQCNLAEIKKAIGDIPLLVDNAHGAYLVFEPELHPNQWADMVCDSAHKTLPVLTGGAYLHINNPIYIQGAKEQMALFGTSSPSYLILESLDKCNRFISQNKNYYEIKDAIHHLKEKLLQQGWALKPNTETMRITILARKNGYTGNALADVLSSKGITCELSDENHVVLLFSPIMTVDTIKRISEVFLSIPMRKSISSVVYPVLKPNRIISPRKAYFSETKTVPIDDALGGICASVVAPCPPGIPLVMPGELIGTKEINVLKLYYTDKIKVIYD